MDFSCIFRPSGFRVGACDGRLITSTWLPSTSSSSPSSSSSSSRIHDSKPCGGMDMCVCVGVCVCVWVCSPWVAGFRFRRLVEMEEEIRELTGEGGAASCSSPKTKCQTSPFCSEVQVLRPLSPLKPRAQEPATGNAVDFVCKHVYEGQPEPVHC